MKEISGELRDRDVVICVECGAIFEGAEEVAVECLECKSDNTRWVTQGHSWIESLTGNKQPLQIEREEES